MFLIQKIRRVVMLGALFYALIGLGIYLRMVVLAFQDKIKPKVSDVPIMAGGSVLLILAWPWLREGTPPPKH